MASKVFLLAIVLAAVAIAECRPKASKSFSNYGVHSNQPSGEVMNDSQLLSTYGNAKNRPIDYDDSSSSESQENLRHGTGVENIYNLRRNLQLKNSKAQRQWQNYQPNQYQPRGSEEYQQQGQYQGQGYDSRSSRQYQQYQQSSEGYNAQLQSGYSQRNGYKHQPQYQNEQSYEEAKPVQVQISGNWKSGASWQNPNQQSSEESPQKYNSPRQVPQKANSDESSSSSSEESAEQWHNQRQQAQARSQMYNKSNQRSPQQQSNEQTNPGSLNSSQQQSSEESMEIQKANKIIVKHPIGEVQGRTVANQQRSRVTVTSSGEGQSKEIISGGRNAIYHY